MKENTNPRMDCKDKTKPRQNNVQWKVKEKTMKVKLRKMNWLVLAGLGFGSFATTSMAIPYASSKCNKLKAAIQHPQGSQGVMFDEECRTAYVLPPEEGDAAMKALAVNSNMNFCSSVNRIPQLSEKMVDSLDTVGSKVLAMIKDFEPQNAALQELREQTDTINADYELLKTRFDELEIQEGELKQAYIEAKNAYQDCKDLNDGDEEKCANLRTDAEIAKTEWTGLKIGEFKETLRTLSTKKNELDKTRRKLARFTEELTTSLNPLFELQERLFTLKDKLSEMYKEYASLRGVTGQITFAVKWSEILNDYQKQNKESGLNFVKMPIIDAKVHATAYVDRTNAQAGIPVLLHAAIPGLGEMGVEKIGSGDVEVKPDEIVPDEVKSAAFGLGDAAISGQMTLSLVGTCPYYADGIETNREEINSDELTAYMTVNAVYEFPIKARRKYKANYHLARMMERFERKKKSNGFFSSKTVHEVTESSSSNDWFKISLMPMILSSLIHLRNKMRSPEKSKWD